MINNIVEIIYIKVDLHIIFNMVVNNIVYTTFFDLKNRSFFYKPIHLF